MESSLAQPEMIVMLTYNDKTVQDAHSLFSTLADTPVNYFGFKDVGLPTDEMKRLVDSMNAAGKITCLEVVSLSEEEGLRGAELAVELGFGILMGTVYFDSINDYLREKPVRYYPFPGHVQSHPSLLDGTFDEIVEHARFLESKGVDGMDLLTYRFRGANPGLLLKDVVAATSVPVVSAGSIDSYDRLGEVCEAGAWGFTIGTAFFDKKFSAAGPFRDNVMCVHHWLEERARSME